MLFWEIVEHVSVGNICLPPLGHVTTLLVIQPSKHDSPTLIEKSTSGVLF
jgi:hypothetical protein